MNVLKAEGEGGSTVTLKQSTSAIDQNANRTLNEMSGAHLQETEDTLAEKEHPIEQVGAESKLFTRPFVTLKRINVMGCYGEHGTVGDSKWRRS